jgi:hypothetical protein
LTRRLAAKWRKACCLVDLSEPPDYARVRQWLAEQDIRVLNVAGPRESSSPGIREAAYLFLHDLLADATQSLS